jgi:acyl-CoA oxidase
MERLSTITTHLSAARSPAKPV